jgi:hypothetical protein
LGGEVESVKIDSTDAGLSVKFISDDKTLLGNVSSDNKDFPTGEYGVYTTSQLKGLLSVLDSDISVKEGDAALVFSDKGTSVNYMLADLSVIPVVPDLKQLPDFTSTIKMDNDFVNKFVKSKGALSDSDTFTFSCKSNKGEVILGYSKINSNRISINVECECDGDVEPISFSAKYLKEILNANKGAKSSSLKISPNGLAHVSFENDGFKSNYYLVEIK